MEETNGKTSMGPQITLDLLMKILNSVEEGIEAVDIHGNLFLYNPAMEILEGQKASDVLGKHMTEIYYLDWKTSLLLKVLNEKKPIFNQHQHYSIHNGKCFDVLVSAVPLFNNDEIVGAAAIMRDFSKFREMAEKILDLQERLNNNQSAHQNKSNLQDHHKMAFEKLLGNNIGFQQTVAWAKEAALTGAPILIYGETGTGKEFFAQSIHKFGKNSAGPFVAINCAAIPETLLEGILFGTVKGAFTGAINRPGLFEQAAEGTIFLDEINSMPLSLQAKLLRVLEEKKFRRLGGSEEISIIANIISSCNVEPMEAIKNGILRSDLFYRLAVVYLQLPPLRDRLDDIELLAKHFISEMNFRLNKNVLGLREDVLSAFKKFPWPGNIRQLKHTIECAMSISHITEDYITPENIPKYLSMDFPDMTNKEPKKITESITRIDIRKQIQEKEKDTIIDVLNQTKGNLTKAAAQLGMSRQSLWYRMKKYHLC